MNPNFRDFTKNVNYDVVFEKNPYSKENNIVEFLPRYILERHQSNNVWNESNGYKVTFTMAEQYCQDFEKFLKHTIQKHVREYTKMYKN